MKEATPMAGMKKLINRTGSDLKVTLVVRAGDQPDQTAGSVEVDMAAGPDKKSGKDGSVQNVSYGNDVDIYLNGIETRMIHDGSAIGERRVVIERGSKLDNALNTNDTIEFLYDGKSILISATNSDYVPFSFTSVDK
jgi:hypothetical protein